MKPLIIIFLTLSMSLTGLCQAGKLYGTVHDAESKTPLELATVSVYAQDSTLIMYRLSDKEGIFAFDKLPVNKKLLVSITYSGYKAFYKTLQLLKDKRDTLTVLLSPNLQDTNAIVISTTVPIRMNGDTLEINPAAFKTDKNAVVEELLQQVSGITIWSDGSITVNGKPVQNLLVDGKPFLGSTDPRVATQNLPKTAIDKIQLYQEYDRSQVGRDTQPQDSLLTMNIKLKESSKKGYFGKAGAGYGTTNRYEADVTLQVYNKKSSAGVGGGINNINKSIGNLQEMFLNNTYRNFNPTMNSVGRFGANGINQNHSVGTVFTHNFTDVANSRQNNRMTINYNTSGVDAFVTDLNLQTRTTVANPQYIREEGVQNNRNNRHEVGINYEKTNSYNDNLNINGSASTSTDRGSTSRFIEVRDSANSLQSTNNISAVQRRQSQYASFNASFAKTNEDEPVKNVSVQINGRVSQDESERDTRTVFESLVDRSKNVSHNRRYQTSSELVGFGGTIDYGGFKRLLLGRYNLFGIGLNFTQSFNYLRTSSQNIVSDYDSTAKRFFANEAISHNNTREFADYTPAMSLSKNFSKWSGVYYRNIYVQVRLSEEFKTERNQSSIARRNLDRSFKFFRYDGNVGYNYSKREKYQYRLSLNYNRNFDYPSIDQLYTIVDDINAYETRIGNPKLRNRINQRLGFNGNFNTQNPKSAYSLTGSLNAGINRSMNPVVDSVINDLSGKRISYYTNGDRNGNVNLGYSVSVSRKFNQNQLQLSYSGQFSKGNNPNYIDGVYNTSKTGNLSHHATLQFSLRTILVLNLNQSFQRYTAKQTAAGLNSFTNKTNSTRLGVVLNYPAHFSFSSTVDYIGNSSLNKPTVLWHSFITHRFLKQQGELKFSAMDILKQYKNITNSVNAYGTTTRITNGLQQFFLLTFSYFPRHFGKTALKEQTY